MTSCPSHGPASRTSMHEPDYAQYIRKPSCMYAHARPALDDYFAPREQHACMVLKQASRGHSCGADVRYTRNWALCAHAFKLCDRYERRFIERWLAHGCTRCPCSGQSLVPPVLLMPNVALRKCIEEWADDHATWLLVSAPAP